MVVSEIVVLRTCAVGDGFHALHWKMLSWLGCGTNVLRCLRLMFLALDVFGGWSLCFVGFGVERVASGGC